MSPGLYNPGDRLGAWRVISRRRENHFTKSTALHMFHASRSSSSHNVIATSLPFFLRQSDRGATEHPRPQNTLFTSNSLHRVVYQH